jgi:hypothetical protein
MYKREYMQIFAINMRICALVDGMYPPQNSEPASNDRIGQGDN